MNIFQLSIEIWKLYEMNWSDFSLEEQKNLNIKLESTIKLLKEKIEDIDSDISALLFILEEDQKSFSMPIDVMFKVFQRIILLDYQTKEHLNAFARYLYWYGPDWEDEAENILRYLGEDNISAAKAVGLSVDYDKYN